MGCGSEDLADSLVWNQTTIACGDACTVQHLQLGLLRRRALWSGAYVYGARPPQQLADVLERFAPPLAPWTRCTACNGELTSVPKEDILELIEPGTRRNYDDYARCLECERVYWRGAHARRISEMIRQARKAHPDYPD